MRRSRATLLILLSGFAFGALALEKIAMFIALGLAILVAGFCVFGTLTLFVQQKGRRAGRQ